MKAVHRKPIKTVNFFLSDYKDTAITIHQTWKRIAEIEQNQRLLPFDSDEQQEIIQLKNKLTKLINSL